MRHLRPAGKPAPPRPRRPESSIALMTASASSSPLASARGQRVAAVRAVGGVVDEGGRDFARRRRDRRRPTLCSARTRPSSKLTAGARRGLRSSACSTWSASASGTAPGRPPPRGACSQRPMQGAGITRTSCGRQPSSCGRRASRSCAPASSQARPSQTRTVSARRLLVAAQDLEVVIEGRDLVDLGHRQVHQRAPAPPGGGRAGRGRQSLSLCRCSISRSRGGAGPGRSARAPRPATTSSGWRPLSLLFLRMRAAHLVDGCGGDDVGV